MCPGWGLGEGNGTRQLFCSWRTFPGIPAPPAQTLRLVNKSPFEAPQAFFKPLLVCRTAFLRARTQFPVTLLAFPEPNLLIIKFQVCRPADCKNSWSYAPRVFKAKCRDSPCLAYVALMSVSFLSWLLWCPSLPWMIPQVPLCPDLVCPSYLLGCGLFSPFSCRESVLVVFGFFSGLFILMWLLSSWIKGTRWA